MDYHDRKKQKKITWSVPQKADRPKSKPKSLKDLITATMSRHGIERQVSAGLVVERLNTYLREHAPELATHVRVISVKFNVVKIGIAHRIYQTQTKTHEDAFRGIIQEVSHDPVQFQYVLRIAEEDML